MTSARAAARAAKPALESHRKQTYTVGKRKLNVIAPSHAAGADEDIKAAPPCDLELAHVYGYNGRRSRNNAFYLGDGAECVYNIARMCVVLGTRSEMSQNPKLGSSMSVCLLIVVQRIFSSISLTHPIVCRPIIVCI